MQPTEAVPGLRRTLGRLALALAALVVVSVAVMAGAFWAVDRLSQPLQDVYGVPSRGARSADGRFELVEHRRRSGGAPAWTITLLRRPDGLRDWIWTSAGSPSPASFSFVDADTVEVVGSDGATYRVDFDPAALRVERRYCLSASACAEAPYRDFTHTSAG